MNKQKLSALTLFILSSLLLNACGGEAPAVDTTAPAETTPAETEYVNPYGDNLPEKMDLGGYDFRVLIFDKGNIIGHNNAWRAWIDIDEQNGETLNDAAYARNIEVEERLNVKISCIEQGGFGQTVPIVQSAVLAGDDMFDFVILQNDRTTVGSLLQEGMLMDINTIDAIDLSQPYYLQSVTDVFNIKGKQFLLSGDGLCSLYSHSYIFTNMDLWNEYKLEDPYALVREGKWTFDKCFSIVKDTYKDLNGDSTADKEDFWGITGLPATITYCFHSGGGKMYEADDKGYSFPVASERNIAIVERLVKELDNPDAFFGYANSSEYNQAFFAGRSIMFMSGSSITTLRNAEFYAGLLPFPKYDEAQKEYYSILAGAIGGIPITVSDAETVGTIVEAYFSASARYLKPAFIQTYVEQKVLQDEGSQEMFDLIMNSGRHNFVDYVDPASQFGGYDVITRLVSAGDTNLASTWASMEASVKENYAKFFAAME